MTSEASRQFMKVADEATLSERAREIQKMFKEALAAQTTTRLVRNEHGRFEYVTGDQWAKHKEDIVARYSSTKGKDVATKKKTDAPDPTVPTVGDRLKYLIWDTEYGAFYPQSGTGGYKSNPYEASRWTVEEMTQKELYSYMIPGSGSSGRARLVAMPAPEWHEALGAGVFDNDSGDWLEQLGKDAGDMEWTSDRGEALVMPLPDARVALEKVCTAYKEDDEDCDVTTFEVRLIDAPVPDEVLTFYTTGESRLYNREGVEAAAEKVKEAFANPAKHYTGSYVESDPVDEFTDAVGQHLYDVHTPDKCAGPYCPIHGDSMHHMNTWPLVWNAKDRIFTRRCEHGADHPDPDDKRVNDDPLLGNHPCCDFVCCVNTAAMEYDYEDDMAVNS